MLATRRTNRRGEEGFALILAILALMLLTSLGLSLSTTTSTELQIATNQRWAKQARYNAEAGVEFAKEILSATPNWNDILPPARPASGSPVTPTWAKNRND
jgi:Tfp pilus assembly protein PilX